MRVDVQDPKLRVALRVRRDRAIALLQGQPLEWLTAELTMPITDVPRDFVEAQLAEAIVCVGQIVARGR